MKKPLRALSLFLLMVIVGFTLLTAQSRGNRLPIAKNAKTVEQTSAWLFAYFKEPGSQGVYLALSRDGLHYTPLNDGQPWIAPTHPGEIMRDVYLTHGPDGRFHMVWTWNWKGNSLGYASSPDLLTWSEQKEIPIMQDFPATNNVWAPEIYFDTAQSKWLMIWSSSMKDSKEGHRIWSSMTADFSTFTKPAVFFDPGYVVIDATIFHQETGHGETGPYRLIFKDQTLDPLTYQERVATGPTLEGPWSAISGPINESWSEGPSAIQVGDRYIVFYDHYRAPHARYEAVATQDWKHWEDITDQTTLPAFCKHGSFLKITDEEATRLLTRHDALKPEEETAK
jgi:hypothetical protein